MQNLKEIIVKTIKEIQTEQFLIGKIEILGKKRERDLIAIHN